jgi:hypothetical protein
MGGFRKAKAEQAALKIAFYGLSGSGKTFTSLLCAEGLAKLTGKRAAYIDTEHGTDFYSQEVKERLIHPEAFDFDALYTRSLTEILRELHTLDPNKYCCVILDSITHIWEATIAAYAGKTTSIGSIPMYAWGKIKKPYKDLMRLLLESPFHVFILGRQGNDFEHDEERDELIKVGVKLKAEGETAYEPHILIHMETVKRKKGDAVITAYAEKDRTGILSGKTIQFPNFDSLIKPLLPLLGEKQALVEDPDAVAAKDAEILSQDENTKEKDGQDIVRRMCALITLCKDVKDLKAIGREITPELKKRMTPQQVTELRDAYLEMEGKLTK